MFCKHYLKPTWSLEFTLHILAGLRCSTNKTNWMSICSYRGTDVEYQARSISTGCFPLTLQSVTSWPLDLLDTSYVFLFNCLSAHKHGMQSHGEGTMWTQYYTTALGARQRLYKSPGSATLGGQEEKTEKGKGKLIKKQSYVFYKFSRSGDLAKRDDRFRPNKTWAMRCWRMMVNAARRSLIWVENNQDVIFPQHRYNRW